MNAFTENFIDKEAKFGHLIPRNIACRILGISQQALDSVIRCRKITTYKVDGMNLLRLDDIIKESVRREAKKRRLLNIVSSSAQAATARPN